MGIIKEYSKYFLKSIQGLFNNEIRRNVLLLGTKDMLKISHPGELYKGEIICDINYSAPYSGFSSLLDGVILRLILANEYGLKPVISLDDSMLYSEQEMIERGINLFEYYFKQPTKIGISEIGLCKNVVLASSSQYLNTNIYNRLFDQDDFYNGIYAEVIKKYIIFNKKTSDILTRKKQEIINEKKVLGVQIRATDFKAGFNDHSVYVPTNEYYGYIDRLIQEKKYERIFIATDDQRVINEMSDKYGDILFYCDVYRAEDDLNIGIHCRKSNRELHHYKLGLEVLTDMFLLSCCDSLVACRSSVPYYSMLFKMSRGERYNRIQIIDKGKYKSKKISKIEIEKMYNEYK